MKASLVLFGILLCSIGYADTVGFTAKEKACFDALSEIDLNSFTPGSSSSVLAMHASSKFLHEYFDVYKSRKEAHKQDVQYIVGAVEIHSDREVRICTKQLTEECAITPSCRDHFKTDSCLQEIRSPLDETNRQRVFNAIAGTMYDVRYNKEFFFPKYRPFLAAMKTCQGVNGNLTRALATVESVHPYRPVEGVTYPDHVLQ